MRAPYPYFPVEFRLSARLVEQENFGVLNRMTDRNSVAGDLCFVVDKILQGHCGFGGSEPVDENRLRGEILSKQIGILFLDFLSSQNNKTDCRQVPLACLWPGRGPNEVSIDSGCRVIDGDLFLRYPIGQS